MTEAAEVHRRAVLLYPAILAGDYDESLPLIHQDVVDHRGGAAGDHVGKDAWRAKYRWLRERSDICDVSVTVEQTLSVGDISVNRYTSRGTDPRTGRRFAVTSMDMIRVVDGQIIEHWALQDQQAIRHQLGLDQP
jgi:predicted ester cyclase